MGIIKKWAGKVDRGEVVRHQGKGLIVDRIETPGTWTRLVFTNGQTYLCESSAYVEVVA